VTRTALLPFAAIKELRALWLAWLAIVVWIVASDVLAFPPLIGMATYFLGAVVLGALSVGHEYSHHTLALLLSQPARRERVLLVKLGVLAAMLLALAAVAHLVAFRHIRAPESEKLAAFVLPVVGGLFVAPWLTMVCRNPLGGAVFTLVIPGVLHVIGDLLGLGMYARSAEADRLRMGILSWGAISFCVLGAVMTWRMFRRLEAIDGRGPDVRLPQWLRWRTTTRTETTAFRNRHPLWLLATKELRLQQLAFVVAGLYVLGSLGVVSLSRLTPQQSAVFDVLTTFYALLIAVLIGSLASAEERQLGTLAWQLLLPIATAKQWAVKVAIAFGLALPLALGLPALMAFLHPTADMIRFSEHVFQPPVMVAVILLIAVSLYVSSLCTSGLWTLLISVPAIFGATQFVKFLGDELGPRVFGVFRLIAIGGADQIPFKSLIALLLTGFLVLILRFGLINHRSTERPAGRVSKQVIWMAAYVTLGVVLVTGLAGLTAH